VTKLGFAFITFDRYWCRVALHQSRAKRT